MAGYKVIAAGDLGIRSLQGWSLAENAGTPAAARVVLSDGSGGAVIADIRFAASGSDHESFGTEPIETRNNIFATITGTVQGSLYGG